MSCVDDVGALKMHIRYGGLMAYKRNKFSYSGGVSVRDLLIDPDLLTWSIFEDFIKDRGIKNKVEQVWYKLISEDISMARSIYKNKDVEIRKLCEETKGIGEVDLYIDYGVECSERSEDEEQSEDENREKLCNVEETIQNETREKEEKAANDGQQSEDEDQILSEGATDAQFTNLLSQAEHNETTQPIQPPPAYDEFGSDSESEDERPLQADEYPDSPVDTDEEWANFHKEDRRERRKKKGETVKEAVLISFS